MRSSRAVSELFWLGHETKRRVVSFSRVDPPVQRKMVAPTSLLVGYSSLWINAPTPYFLHPPPPPAYTYGVFLHVS